MSGLNQNEKSKRIMDAIFLVNTKFHFTYLKPDFSNIIEVYNNNLNLWYLNNSDSKEVIDGTEIKINNGILENSDKIIFSKTKDGFELTEYDFINSEFQRFEYLEVNKLKLVEKKQYEYYVSFLKSILRNDNKKKTENNIINNLSFQLNFILKTIKADLKNNYQVYNYKVCEKNQTFLDYYNLKNYITLQEIKNTASLQIICSYCKQIVDLWNKDLENIPCKEFEEVFFCNNVDYTETFLLSSKTDFYCINLFDNDIQNFNTLEGKKEFIKKYQHSDYSLWQIAIKCTDIYNFLTIAFDEIHLKLNVTERVEQPQQTETSKPDEKYKTQNLFKVGLLFANSEMSKYFKVTNKKQTVMNKGLSAPKIASEIKENLGIDINHKYISASINNYTPDKENGNKNIFNSFDMMTKIISHCEAENITVDTYFKSRLPIE